MDNFTTLLSLFNVENVTQIINKELSFVDLERQEGDILKENEEMYGGTTVLYRGGVKLAMIGGGILITHNTYRMVWITSIEKVDNIWRLGVDVR